MLMKIISPLSLSSFQVSRGSHSSKRVVRRVSNQVALAFAKRSLSRYRKFEDTGRSCFSEAPLQDIIFSAPLCSSDLNSVDCVGSRTASNRYKRSRNQTSDLRGSGQSFICLSPLIKMNCLIMFLSW